MKLEDQVASFGYCAKLAELGYPQDKSLFYWSYDVAPQLSKIRHIPEIIYFEKGYKKSKTLGALGYIAAPTVAELGEALPGNLNKLQMFKNDAYNIGWYGDTPEESYIADDMKEADARAEMWIFLKENNLM